MTKGLGLDIYVSDLEGKKFRDLEKDGLWGKADPYVLLTLGDQKAQSGTVGNTQVYFVV